MNRITVFKHLGWTKLTCSLGHKHNTQVYGQKWLWSTDETIIQDWYGYGASTTFPAYIYLDAEGHGFARVAPMDFAGVTTYRGLDTQTFFSSRPSGVRVDALMSDPCGKVSL